MRSSIQLIAGFSSLLILAGLAFTPAIAQEKALWHNQKRLLHYKPDGKSFVLVNGTRKFNRALYGTNSGFRVETGDLPEFALYMPGMGGNFKLGIANGKTSKWITEADSIETRYTPGIMEYTLRDEILGAGSLQLTVVASATHEGFLLKVTEINLPETVDISWLFGGASGKKFHRDGDIGADPESVFYLQPEYCLHNTYTLAKNKFTLDFNWDKKTHKNTKILHGTIPDGIVKVGSATANQNPKSLTNSTADTLPVVYGTVSRNASKTYYWAIENPDSKTTQDTRTTEEAFNEALHKAETLANRVTLKTPDPYLNTLGGALATAADAIWESPAYLHGSVAWRMHLNAWRGAYTADLLGWHDRAKTHFSSYGKSQVLEPETGPVVLDSSRYFARQKEVLGTAMFSEGYISRHPNRNDRAHHYDMNLVFIDQLLTHFKWNKNPQFLKEIFPVIERHLKWEKRNFDANDDGLYDAYATIWASDALQYSGGSVTYTSAYNYRANVLTAKLAQLLEKDPQPYFLEAKKIKNAIQNTLWLPEQGVFAEYKDALGNQLLHKTPGIWTVYHALDKDIADNFQAYQSLNYVSNEIPHIPVAAEGLPYDDLSLVATTNWQPYTWSVNNVALAENLNMALAYWQGNQPEKGFKLFESALVESMYLGASPGGFQQLSFYDAMRGELYRDFADPIGVAARALVEGLFGIKPNFINNELIIQPGFPQEWEQASLHLPDVSLSFKRIENTEIYTLKNNFDADLNLKLELNAACSTLEELTVNGKKATYTMDTNAVGTPKISIDAGKAKQYKIEVKWGTQAIDPITTKTKYALQEPLNLNTSNAEILEVYDPQRALSEIDSSSKKIDARINSGLGHKTVFIKLKHDEMIWWQPINFEVIPKLEIVNNHYSSGAVKIDLQNNASEILEGTLGINTNHQQKIKIPSSGSKQLKLPVRAVVPGTNKLKFSLTSGAEIELAFTNWDIPVYQVPKFDCIDLSSHFNAEVNQIFKQQYWSPRPESPTLQLPTTGIGNWCYPNISEEITIDDSGLRKAAARTGTIKSQQNIPFKTGSQANEENVVFTSKWDTYPDTINIPLTGKASHAYLIMTGTTNPMQTRMENGRVTVTYTDGTSDKLSLKNPENWWPIEQDYYADGYAFTADAPKPPRLIFKTGEITRNFDDYTDIHGFTQYGIDNGAGTLLDLPLDVKKTLQHIHIESITNDVIIGLMSLTLQR
ncbi:DUF4450 domain-containing protein [Leeuwenhoekiella sp. MAR_2009_132]|uniref:DUF4450 domain-containing protein n=1 Tax=Leeuwenhoekiella sp. MAR_2009_132 TaxID=1392489 RepID=UPI00048D0B1B|nr:DUF4450 domain-containing protein [Leeuwenhoekiella sp. MAR_2009_132]